MKNIFRLVLCGGFLCVVSCLFTTTNPLHAQWVQTNGPYSGNMMCMGVSGSNLFAGGYPGGVFLSTNDGIGWRAVSTGLTGTDVRALAVKDTNLFAGIYQNGMVGGGVFLSTNNGTSWTSVDSGLTSLWVLSLVVQGTNLFVGMGENGGLFRSTNNGTSWTAVDSGLTSLWVTSLAAKETNLFAGTSGGLFLSTNNGTSWTAVHNGFPNIAVTCFAVGGGNLFAGTPGGVFRSTDNGWTWTSVSSYAFMSIAVSGSNVFAGSTGNGVFLSTNAGTSWAQVNTGLTDTLVQSLAISGRNLFAGTYNGGVWRRPLTEMITSAEKSSPDLPKHLSLQQNYPNPFNPTTLIRYTVADNTENGVGSREVKLAVYDVLGREVAVLVNERKGPGSYEVQLNASRLPSGSYLYRLQAGVYSATKKLVLLR